MVRRWYDDDPEFIPCYGAFSPLSVPQNPMGAPSGWLCGSPTCAPTAQYLAPRGALASPRLGSPSHPSVLRVFPRGRPMLWPPYRRADFRTLRAQTVAFVGFMGRRSVHPAGAHSPRIARHQSEKTPVFHIPPYGVRRILRKFATSKKTFWFGCPAPGLGSLPYRLLIYRRAATYFI